MPVVVMPLEHCGSCPICSRGEFSHCPNKKWIGLSSEWGGLGDLVSIHAYQVSPLQGISALDGALIEPAAVAMNAVLRARVAPGSEVLVVGCGPIGAFAVMAAFTAGAARVFVREPNAARAAIASDLGAHVSSDFAEAEVDAAIDCAGQVGTTAACISAVRPGGRVCVPAVHKDGSVIDIRAITRRELSVVGSMGYTREVWHRTLQLVRSGRLPVDNTVDGDQARRAIATILSNGTVFRIVEFAPGGRQAPQDRGRTARSRRRRALNFRAAQHPQALVLVGDVDIAPRVDEHVLSL